MITQAELENWFKYHSPTPDQANRYIEIREAAKHFARIVLSNTPPSADQTAAIRKIREAVMTANASIACDNATVKQVRAPHDIKEIDENNNDS